MTRSARQGLALTLGVVAVVAQMALPGWRGLLLFGLLWIAGGLVAFTIDH